MNVARRTPSPVQGVRKPCAPDVRLVTSAVSVSDTFAMMVIQVSAVTMLSIAVEVISYAGIVSWKASLHYERRNCAVRASKRM